MNPEIYKQTYDALKLGNIDFLRIYTDELEEYGDIELAEIIRELTGPYESQKRRNITNKLTKLIFNHEWSMDTTFYNYIIFSQKSSSKTYKKRGDTWTFKSLNEINECNDLKLIDWRLVPKEIWQLVVLHELENIRTKILW